MLYELQSGFRSSFSTDSCLIHLSDFIRKQQDKGHYTGMVILDLQKAFDTVNHKILLDKLRAMGVGQIAVQWFNSYLSGRQQLVNIADTNSDFRNVLCGVPQGQGWPVAFTGGICHRYLPVNTGVDNTPKSGVYRHLLAFINISLISLQITLLTVIATYYIIHGHHSTIFAAYA